MIPVIFFSRLLLVHLSAFDMIAEAMSMIKNPNILFILQLICYKYRAFFGKPGFLNKVFDLRYCLGIVVFFLLKKQHEKDITHQYVSVLLSHSGG